HHRLRLLGVHAHAEVVGAETDDRYLQAGPPKMPIFHGTHPLVCSSNWYQSGQAHCTTSRRVRTASKASPAISAPLTSENAMPRCTPLPSSTPCSQGPTIPPTAPAVDISPDTAPAERG